MECCAKWTGQRRQQHLFPFLHSSSHAAQVTPTTSLLLSVSPDVQTNNKSINPQTGTVAILTLSSHNRAWFTSPASLCCYPSTVLLCCEEACASTGGTKPSVSPPHRSFAASALSSDPRLSAGGTAPHEELPGIRAMLFNAPIHTCALYQQHSLFISLQLAYHPLRQHLFLVHLQLSPPGVEYPTALTLSNKS